MGNKVWLNSKCIKTKRNRKLEAKFFGPFKVLHPVWKQAYKLELLKKWRIHDVFYLLLLERDNTRKGQVDENVTEFDAGDDEEYEVEGIRDSVVYARESKRHLPGLHYLISWKNYPEEENTWEPIAAVLQKLISLFLKEHRHKPTATSSPIDTASPIARPKVRPSEIKNRKRKRGRHVKSANKQAKKN